jgi:hypothetical protein
MTEKALARKELPDVADYPCGESLLSDRLMKPTYF